ncbi:MAG: GntR family transcriptional regulator, partial [Planctomycetota bacterium]
MLELKPLVISGFERTPLLLDKPKYEAGLPGGTDDALTIGRKRLLGLIAGRSVRPGDPILPERALAERLGVGRKAIRDELQRLESEGVIGKAGKRARVLRVQLTPDGQIADDQAPPAFQPLGPATKRMTLLVDPVRHPKTHTQPGWSFFIASGATFEAATQGWEVLTLAADLRNEEADEAFWRDQVDQVAANTSGVVLSPPYEGTPDLERALSAAGVPTVSYQHAAEVDRCLKVDRVLPDQAAGAGMIVDHLAALGCQRIVQVKPRSESFPWWLERRRGFEEAMQRHGLAVTQSVEIRPPTHWIPPDVVPDDFDEISRNFAGHLIEQLTGPDKVDALLLPGDAIVPAVARACRLFGLEPNVDVLLAGYDNLMDGHWALAHEPVGPV